MEPTEEEGARVQVRLLGPLEVDGDDGRRAELGGRQAQALVALLAIDANRAVPVSRLIDELWPDDPPASARKTVQTYVSRLRKALGEERLQTAADGYRLVAAPDEIDAAEFPRLVDAGSFDEALALWRGPALTGLEVVPALAVEAERLEQARADALERRADAALAAGEHARLVPELEALVREQPVREALRARLMLALYRSGRQADALETYRQGRALLADELGLEPSEALRDLERRILAQDPELDAPAAAPRAAVRPGRQGAGLPVSAAPFVGRERELAEVVALAADEGVRLVTVTGPGGIGKTSLAIRAAAELAPGWPDGTYWVPLDALRDPTLVVSAIEQALGTTDPLATHVGERRMLILVDNLEHLIDAAPELGAVLTACPALTFLITSRERLAIAGEHEYPLATLTDADGRQLFVERARALDPGFGETPAVAELCRRLDNLPLAVELAAARTKLFTPEQLLARLSQRLDLLLGGRDADARRQTLRGAIAWSHDLLDADERRVFARLAVFRGGWTLEAAEAVCDADPDRLASLLDKSLLGRGDGTAGDRRFTMLESIREYARERLDESDEKPELRRSHAAYFFALAARARDPLGSREQGEWLDRLTDEIENLRCVLAWSLEHDVAEGLRFAGALGSFWFVRGHARELARWFDAAFARAESVPPEVLAPALKTDGDLHCFLLGDTARARELYEEGLAVARQIGDQHAEAWCLNVLGVAISADGNREEGLRHFEQALEMFRRIENGDGAAMALNNIGTALRDLGQFDGATRTFREAIAIYERLGDRWRTSNALHSLADTALVERDVRCAAERYRAALAIAVDLGDQGLASYCLAGLSCVALLSDELGLAGVLWAAAELSEVSFGSRMMPFERVRYERLVADVREQEAFVAGYERGRELTLEDAHGLALHGGGGPTEEGWRMGLEPTTTGTTTRGSTN
jgi:predicted ATPase/DNA-binding SARP family transcriptional activator